MNRFFFSGISGGKINDIGTQSTGRCEGNDIAGRHQIFLYTLKECFGARMRRMYLLDVLNVKSDNRCSLQIPF